MYVKGDKNIVIIERYHCYQLYRIVPAFFLQG